MLALLAIGSIAALAYVTHDPCPEGFELVEAAPSGGGIELEGVSDQTPDWIEISNTTDERRDLGGCLLRRGGKERKLPRVDVAPGTRVVVLLSSDPALGGRGWPVVNLKLRGIAPDVPFGGTEAASERVELLSRSALRSVLEVPATRGRAFGRTEDGALAILEPTPGRPNRAATIAPPGPVFTPAHGVLDGPIDLRIDRRAPGELRVTLDGSEPTSESPTSRGILHLARSAIVRAATFDGAMRSEITTQSYLVLDREDCRARRLPIVSLAGDPGRTFFDPDGLFAVNGGVWMPDEDGLPMWRPRGPNDRSNPTIRGLEREVSVETFAATSSACPGPRDGWPDTTFAAGARVHGGDWGRTHLRECPPSAWPDDWTCKHSLRLHLRSRYGVKGIRNVFAEPGPRRHETLVLVNPTDVDGSVPASDALLRTLARDTGRPTPRGRFVSVFLNAELVGLYELLERPDEDFARGSLGGGEVEVVDQEGPRAGDGRSFLELLEAADRGDFEEVRSRLEVSALIDYLLVQLYGANADWPDNNWVAMRAEGGRFVFVVWDGEDAFRKHNLLGNGLVRFPDWMDGGGRGLEGDSSVARIFRALRNDPRFVAELSTRAKQLLSTGALSRAHVEKRFGEIHAALGASLPELERYIGQVWALERGPIFMGQLESAGLVELRK